MIRTGVFFVLAGVAGGLMACSGGAGVGFADSGDVPDSASDAADTVHLEAGSDGGVDGSDPTGDSGGDSATTPDSSCGAIGKLQHLSCSSGSECLLLDPSTTPPKQWSYVCDTGSLVAYGAMPVGCTAQSDCSGQDCCYQQAATASGCSTVLTDSGAGPHFYSAGGFAGTVCQSGCGSLPRICSSDADCKGATHCVPVTVAPLDAGAIISFGLCQ